MLYKLLGMTVWHGGKLFLRRRYGSTYVPKAVLAGGAAFAVVIAVLALLGARRATSD